MLGFQQLQVQRQELMKRLADPKVRPRRAGGLVRTDLSGALHSVDTTVESLMERFEEIVERLESAVAPLEDRLPTQARDLAKQAHVQAKEARAQIRSRRPSRPPDPGPAPRRARRRPGPAAAPAEWPPRTGPPQAGRSFPARCTPRRPGPPVTLGPASSPARRPVSGPGDLRLPAGGRLQAGRITPEDGHLDRSHQGRVGLELEAGAGQRQQGVGDVADGHVASRAHVVDLPGLARLR